MGKKAVLIAGFVLLILFSGDILYLLTHSGLLANWGSIILPSFLLGALWRLLVKDNLEGMLRYVLAILVGLISVAFLYLTTRNPSLLGAILMLIVYPIVSYIFIGLGVKTISKQG
jgi:hypothetical protein